VHTSYVVHAAETADALEKVHQLSRRARGAPVWAAPRSLGHRGVADLVDGLVAHARALATGITELDGARVLNHVVFTKCAPASDRTSEPRR
jgi:glutamate/tyrosine decarboxylase-like PLP-dependent enzyme